MRIKETYESLGKEMLKVVLDNKLFFSLLLVMNIPTKGSVAYTYAEVEASAVICVFLAQGVSILFQGWILCYIASKINDKKLRSIYKNTVLLLALIVMLCDIFLIYNYHYILDKTMLEILLTIDSASAKEFIVSYITVEILFYLTLAIALVYFLGNIVSFLLKFFCSRYQKLLPIFFIISSIVFITVPDMYYINPIRLPSEFFSFWQNNGEENNIIKNLQGIDEEVVADNLTTPNLVIILGESVDRNHMNSYGYKLNNTPFLNDYLKNGEAYQFSNTIAPGNTTVDTLKLLFTYAEKESTDKWYSHADLFSILKKANYHTTWISNQTEISIFGNMDKIYSSLCDDKFFTDFHDTYNSSLAREIDGVLLPHLEEFIASNNSYERNCYVLHLEGAHEIYKSRYPESFEVFNASDEPLTNEEWQKMQAEYDNAILYSDYIVHEIIERFRDKNAVVIYLSDHGSEVHDGRDFYGHSMEVAGNNHMIEIPLVVWCSPTFRAENSSLCARIDEGKDRAFRTDSLMHLVLDLMQIKSKSYDSSKSPINEAYKNQIYMYNGKPYVKK